MGSALSELIDSRHDGVIARLVGGHHLRAGACRHHHHPTVIGQYDALLTQCSKLLRASADGTTDPPRADAAARSANAMDLSWASDLADIVDQYGALVESIVDEARCAGIHLTHGDIRALSSAVLTALRDEVVSYANAHEAEQRKEVECRERSIAVLGHDLQNPIHAIRLATHALQKRNLDRATLATVRLLARCAQRMGRMTADVLDFARGRAGQVLPLKSSLTNARDICLRVVDEVCLVSPEREIRLTVAGDIAVAWDGERVEQALINIVTNAIQYSPPETAVTMVLESIGDRVRVRVHNQGTPIPSTEIGAMFEPFRRGLADVAVGATTSARVPGLGLGLFIARHIAHSHGGALWATSSAEGGTELVMDLPRGEVPAARPDDRTLPRSALTAASP